MASSYIKYKDSGFWEQDSLLEIWFRILALNLPNNSYLEGHWLFKFRTDLMLASSGICSGWVTVDFDSIILNTEKRDLLLDVAGKTIKNLEGIGPFIPKRFLNSLGIETVFDDVSFENINTVYNSMRQTLLNILPNDGKRRKNRA